MFVDASQTPSGDATAMSSGIDADAAAANDASADISVTQFNGGFDDDFVLFF